MASHTPFCSRKVSSAWGRVSRSSSKGKKGARVNSKKAPRPRQCPREKRYRKNQQIERLIGCLIAQHLKLVVKTGVFKRDKIRQAGCLFHQQQVHPGGELFVHRTL